MSGGHFNYEQHHIQNIIESIEKLKANLDNDSDDPDLPYLRSYMLKDKEKFLIECNVALLLLRYTYDKVNALDCFLSGDASEESLYEYPTSKI